MRSLNRMSLVAAGLLLSASLGAQVKQTADPSGHWDGVVQAPNMQVKIEIDVARGGKGELVGTFGQPSEQLKGYPLSRVTVEGAAAIFELRIGVEGGTFKGAFDADGQSIEGEYTAVGDAYTLPFKLVRTGDARIAAAPRSPAIAKQLEGTWNGALDTQRGKMRLVVKMMNQSDGTAAGTIVSLDGGGVEVPIAMAERPSGLTIEIPSVAITYVGVLNTEGTELVGTWNEKQATLPLTLRRASTPGR